MSEAKYKQTKRWVGKFQHKFIIDFITHINKQPLHTRVRFAWRIIRGK